MVPSPWTFLLLSLAVFRVVRLIGWDDFPPVVRARMWAVGAELTSGPTSVNQSMGVTATRSDEPDWTYRRPLLADLIQCGFCLGFWVAIAEYGWWLLDPRSCRVVAGALALAAAVGLIAKNLDV